MPKTITDIDYLNHKFPDSKRVEIFTRECASMHQLNEFGSRATPASIPLINPRNHRIVERRIAARQASEIDITVASEETTAYRNSLINAANGRDRQSVNEVAAYRQFLLEHHIPASPFAMSFFQTINLSADELPLMVFPRPKNLQRFNVFTSSPNSVDLTSTQWQTSRDATTITMEHMSSERVQYPLMDLQQGNLTEEQNILEELNTDIDMKFDALALAMIDANVMTSGIRSAISIHPSVKTAQVPDYNTLDLTGTGYGPTGKLTLPKLKEIMNHIVMVGSVDPTRQIRPLSMIMAHTHQRDVWDFVSLVSGYDDSTIDSNPQNVVPSAVRDSIFNTGAFANAWGYTFKWELNSQLDPGVIYVPMSEPLGWMFTKSEFDKVHNYDASTDIKYAENNYGEMLQTKAYKFYVPSLWLHRMLKVTF